jgi:23S rRNA (cytidine1920-2'-O)/16S rRNA (cytidine1409-2'-O)-methyltransferase
VSETHRTFVSRAGLKLDHALREFDVDVRGLICADFGCNVGGFTDCLLQRGAELIYAIDTGYGVLDYTLRTDDRVVVMERTNALHAGIPHPRPLSHRERGAESPLPPGEGLGEGGSNADRTEPGVDLITIDLGWTPQRHAIPAALRWLRPNGRIITLIKPHYELTDDEKRALLIDGRLDPENAARITQQVLDAMPELGVRVAAHTQSPITGGKSGRRSKDKGNVEYLALLAR